MGPWPALIPCSILSVLMLPVCSPAQAPLVDVNILAAARQIQEGDSSGALFTLDRAAMEAADQPTVFARVQAFRAWAYLDLDQLEQARAAVRLALKADPKFEPAVAELGPYVRKLFEDVRRGVTDHATDIRPDSVPKATGSAVIYVYYPRTGIAGGGQKVLCDGMRVADLQKGRFIVVNASAGSHIIKAADVDISALFEGGRTHYVRVFITGTFVQRPAIAVVEEAEALAEMRDKEVTANESKHTFTGACGAAGNSRSRK